MSVERLLAVLRRRALTFALTVAGIVAFIAVGVNTLPKSYTSEAYLLVAPSQQAGSDFAATQLTQLLTKTYSELIQTDSVEDEVERRTSTRDPSRVTSVSTIPESQILVISSKGSTPRTAQRVAAAYTQVFLARMGRLRTAGDTPGEVAVAEPASLPERPSGPNRLLMLSLGILIALAAGAAAAWIKDRLDRRLRIDASATEILGLTVVGRMPGTRASDLSRPAMADAWRLTLANLAFANLVGRPSSIAVVSPGPEEGKSTCSLALALAAAEMGISVLIVEGDMRRPTLTEKLGVEGSPAPSGFSTALVRPMGLVEPRTLPIPGFSARLLPAGPLPPNPAALLGTERLAAFHAQAVREFDLVIYDTPPVVVGADASFLALVAEGVVVVVDETRTDRLQATRAVEQLQHARARILGVVVNRSSEAITEYYDYGRRGASNGSAPPEREFEDQISDSRA